MRLLKQSTARDIIIFMTNGTDHVTGSTGLTLTITASKNGGSFSSITPTVTELSNGWYKLALTTSHTDTLGDFGLHITATGADPTDVVMQIVTDLPGASVSSVSGSVTVGTNNDKTGYSLSSAGIQAVWDALTSALTTVGSVGKRIADNLDATVASRLPTSSYTAPDNASITAIKAKTDNLPADPASNTQVNTRLASASYTAPDNTSIAIAKTNTDFLVAEISSKG